MKSATVYLSDTGEILRTLIVPDTHVVRLNDGEALLDGQYDDDKYKVIDGKPVPRATIVTAADQPEPEPMNAQDVRHIRDALLTASDWTQLPDAPVDPSAWALYRAALRDIPGQAGFPGDVIWPERPD